MDNQEKKLLDAVINAIENAGEVSAYPRAALHSIGFVNPLPTLRQIANDQTQDKVIRDEATFYLAKGKIENPLDVSSELHGTLVIEGFKQAIKPLRQILLNRDYSENLRYYAAEYLGKLGDTDSYNLLADTLCDDKENRLVRRGAASGIGALGSDNGIKLLIATMENEDHLLAFTAVEALGEAKHPLAFEPLVEWLNKHKVKEGWNYIAIEALYNFGGEKVFELFLKLLKDENIHVRRFVVSTLYRTWSWDERIIEPLIEVALTEKNAEIRSQAIWSLGNYYKYDKGQITDAIVTALQDNDEVILRSATWSAMQLKNEQLIKPLLNLHKHSVSKIRQNVAQALRYYNDENVIIALKWLSENDT